VVVSVDVDGDDERNVNAQPHPDEGEDVQVVYLDDLSCRGVKELADKMKLHIDANLWMMFAMMDLAPL
jgi:hypothetical protein